MNIHGRYRHKLAIWNWVVATPIWALISSLLAASTLRLFKTYQHEIANLSPLPGVVTMMGGVLLLMAIIVLGLAALIHATEKFEVIEEDECSS